MGWTASTVEGSLELTYRAFKQRYGIGVETVLYKSGAEVAQALLANQIQLAFVSNPFFGHVREGRLKMFVTFAPRSPLLPADVPTFRELGIPDLGNPFIGVHVRAGERR